VQLHMRRNPSSNPSARRLVLVTLPLDQSPPASGLGLLVDARLLDARLLDAQPFRIARVRDRFVCVVAALRRFLRWSGAASPRCACTAREKEVSYNPWVESDLSIVRFAAEDPTNQPIAYLVCLDGIMVHSV
jgi:hypothetical protein